MSDPFVAEIRIFAGNYAPRGWAFCNGQLLPIAQNTALFSLIGTTYGGDGRTTTALPNLQGRAPMHPGRGPGLTARRLGERVGVATVTLSESQIPPHTHGVNSASDTTTATPDANSIPGATPMYGAGATTPMASGALGNTGGGGAHSNLQPYMAINFIISLQGIYPSRS